MSVGEGVSEVMAVLKGRMPRCGLWESNRWSLSLCERLATACGHLAEYSSTDPSLGLQLHTSIVRDRRIYPSLEQRGSDPTD